MPTTEQEWKGLAWVDDDAAWPTSVRWLEEEEVMSMPTIDQVSEKIGAAIEAPGSGFKRTTTAGRSQTRDGEGETGVRLDRYTNGEIEISVIVEKPKRG